MHRTALLALCLGLLTASPAMAVDLSRNDAPALGDKTEPQDLGVLAPLGCSLGSGQVVLPEATTITGSLDTTTGANCEFAYTPPMTHNGAKFVLTLTTSDFDLYVRKGAVPTTSLYDCRPFLGGVNSENCLGVVADATPIYVMVRRFSGSGEFTIRGEAVTLHPACPAGNNAIAPGGSADFSTPVALGAACYFQLTPGADNDLIRFTATPEGAAFGIYVKRGDVPTTSSYDCIASASFLVRTCELVADSRDIFVMVRRSTSVGFGQFHLDALGIQLPALTLGTPVQDQVAHLGYDYFKVVVPAGSKVLGLALVGTSPQYACNASLKLAATPCPPEAGVVTNADLYVRHASKLTMPSTSLYDCRSWAFGINDACILSADASGALAQAGVSGAVLEDPQLGHSPVNVVNYVADGKYFVAVRGVAGPADYAIAAVYA